MERRKDGRKERRIVILRYFQEIVYLYDLTVINRENLLNEHCVFLPNYLKRTHAWHSFSFFTLMTQPPEFMSYIHVITRCSLLIIVEIKTWLILKGFGGIQGYGRAPLPFFVCEIQNLPFRALHDYIFRHKCFQNPWKRSHAHPLRLSQKLLGQKTGSACERSGP